MSAWYTVISRYVTRQLTVPTDRLLAIGGVAAVVYRAFSREWEDVVSVEYIAGLWSHALLDDLAWTPNLGYAVTTTRGIYTGPSWSWAGYAGVLSVWRFNLASCHVTEVVEWGRTLKMEVNPYGEVKDAWIRVRGPMATLLPDEEQFPPDDGWWLNMNSKIEFPKLTTRY